MTVFEALHELGGVLVYGIPEFRLPKETGRAATAQLLEGVDVAVVAIGNSPNPLLPKRTPDLDPYSGC